MYNGIGLQTARGSGTNGHVQRNWAFVRPGKKDNLAYKTEEDISKLEATLNRQPNQDILDHQRKRKIEVKCAEFEEILEKQGCDQETIKTKITSYRMKLMGQGKTDHPKDEFGRIIVRETHQVAEAQQEKNSKLREAFGISEYFIEGSSFDPDRRTKEDLVKRMAQHDEQKMQQESEKDGKRKYSLVRTPPKEKNNEVSNKCNGKKKKKRKYKEMPSSPNNKKEKTMKSKKKKKERSKKKKSKKEKVKYSDSESDSSEFEGVNKHKKAKKEKEKHEAKKKHSLSTVEPLYCSPPMKSKTTSKIKKAESIEKHETLNSIDRERCHNRDHFAEITSDDLPIEEVKIKSNMCKDQKKKRRKNQRKSPEHRTQKDNRCKNSNPSQNVSLKSFSRNNENDPMHLSSPKTTTKKTESAKFGNLQDYGYKNSFTPEREVNDECETLIKSQGNEQLRSRTSNRKRIHNIKFGFFEQQKWSAKRIRLSKSPPERQSRLNETSKIEECKYEHSFHPKQFKSKDLGAVKSVSISRSPQNNQRQYMRTPSPKHNIHETSSMKNKSSLTTPKTKRLNPFRVESKITRKLNDRNAISLRTSHHQNSLHYGRSCLRSSAKQNSHSPRSNYHHSPSKEPNRLTVRKEKNISTTQASFLPKEKLSHTVQSNSEWKSQEIKSLKWNSKDANVVHSQENSKSDCLNFQNKQQNQCFNKDCSEKVKSTYRPSICNKKCYCSQLETSKVTSESPSAYYVPISLLNTSNKTQSAEIPLQSEISKANKNRVTARSTSESSDLSYSPARRDPERYRNILEEVEKECKPHEYVDLIKKRCSPTITSKKIKFKDEDNERSSKKNSQPGIHLYCQNESEDDKSNDHNAENFVEAIVNENTFLDKKDIQKEIEMLEALKSGIAAKARKKIKTIEKMANEVSPKNLLTRNNFLNAIISHTNVNKITSHFEDTYNHVELLMPGDPQFSRIDEDFLINTNDSSSLVANSLIIPDKFSSCSLKPICLQKPKIVIKPFKISESQSCAPTSVLSLNETNLMEKNVAKITNFTTASALDVTMSPKCRSRSKLLACRKRSKSGSKSSYTSTISRSSSSYRSRSHSTVSSSSSRSSQSRSTSSVTSKMRSRSRSHSGTRSPSIPRRRGSPSFLDRRRITSARKRPIPYHRPTPSPLSSGDSSYESRHSSQKSNHSSSKSRSSSNI